MRLSRPSTPSAFLALLLSFAGAAAACGGGNAAGPGPQPPPLGGEDGGAPSATTTTASTTGATAPTPSTTASTPATSGSASAKPPPDMKPIVATAMVAELKAIGLDVKKLPPLGKLDPQKLRKVMDLFTKSLGGVECTMCHVKNDFKAMTPKKNIAGHMWDDFVRRYETADSKPVFCDSCHQGRVDLLNRVDRKSLAKYMSDVYVDGIKLKDGKDHDCATCHGDITAPPFLDDKWAKSWKSQ
jgi:hypothetical protein